ncbi:alanine--tRNA ligase [Tanacetum coccineum]
MPLGSSLAVSSLADSWKMHTNTKTLIKFLVSCHRRLHFISSVDATDFVEDAPILFNILDKLVDEMGEENVVITQNTPSYQAAGKMLEEKRQNLIALKHLFQSTKWLSSQISKFEEGQEIEKIVLNATFWKKVQYIRRSVGPILQVLQKINGDDENLSMAYIYNDMFKAKLEIKCNHGDDTRKYGNI